MPGLGCSLKKIQKIQSKVSLGQWILVLHKTTLGLKSQLRKQTLVQMRSEKLKGSQETMLLKSLKLQTEKLKPTHTPCQSSGQGRGVDYISDPTESKVHVY